MEGDVITMQDIFVFEPTGVNESGQVLGQFRATGVRPRFEPRLQALGLHLPADCFDPQRRIQPEPMPTSAPQPELA